MMIVIFAYFIEFQIDAAALSEIADIAAAIIFIDILRCHFLLSMLPPR
jgi:hypothetical protein